MPYITPAFAAIRTDLLRDLKNQLPEADVAVDSDFFVRATSVASCVEGLYQHQAWIVRQIFPDTADTEYLEWHAGVRALSRRPAVAASGSMHVVGTPGATIAQDLVGVTPDGRRYQPIETGVIDADGLSVVPARATEPGLAGNADDDTPVTFASAPPGLTSASLLDMRGGTDIETDAELLARLLDIIRRPPAGGNRHDYRRWALEVPGVTAAFVYPLRRGLGTVDIAIVSGDGLPSEQTLDAVRDHIDSVRPVTAKSCVVLAPTLRLIDMDISLGVAAAALDPVQPLVMQALADQFRDIAPGAPWIRSQSEALISNVPGVSDRLIASPAENIYAVVNADTLEWLRLGQVTLDVMP